MKNALDDKSKKQDTRLTFGVSKKDQALQSPLNRSEEVEEVKVPEYDFEKLVQKASKDEKDSLKEPNRSTTPVRP